MQQNILGTASIGRLFFKFSIPAILSMVISGLQGVVDGIFVGNLLGPDAMAGVSIANPFLQLIIGVSMVTSIGCQSHVGLKLGEKKEDSAQDAFRTILCLIIGLSTLLSISGFLFSDKIAATLGASDVLLPYTGVYIKYLSLYAVPICIMFYFGFLNRIIEKPQLYFYGAITNLCGNITLNYLFIDVLDLGIAGAANATGLSYSLALAFVTGPMLKKSSTINIWRGHFDKSAIVPVLYNGSSEGVNSFSMAITSYLFNITFLRYAGEAGVTAFTAINYICQFGIILMFGISDGIGPIVSYNFGAKLHERVSKIIRLSYKCCIVIGIFLFSILFFGGRTAAEIFVGNNEEILALAETGSRIYAFAFLVIGFNIVRSGIFTFVGKGLESAIIASIRGFLFIIIGVFTLPLIFGMEGVWLSIPFAEFSAALVGIYLFKHNAKYLSGE